MKLPWRADAGERAVLAEIKLSFNSASKNAKNMRCERENRKCESRECVCVFDSAMREGEI